MHRGGGGATILEDGTVHTTHTPSPELIGRRAELETLLEAFDRAASGCIGMLAVTGDAGVGKSRLIAELVRRVEGRAAIGVGSCVEHLQAPFLPLAEAFRGLGLENELFAQLPPVGTAPRRMRTEQQLAALRAVTRVLLGAPVGRPFVLAIEDLQWADAATLGLLEQLAIARVEGPLLVVVSVREEALRQPKSVARTLARMQSGRLVPIALAPLSAAETTLLIRAASPRPVGREVAERIRTLSEGNPLVAEELLTSALDEHGNAMHPLRYTGIRSTVLDRLYQLSERDQRVLTSAAVVGQFFDPHLVARLIGLPPTDVLAALRRARNVHLVREHDERGVAFRHAIFSEIVYRELLAIEARELHRRVAEELSADAACGRDAEIAYHWSAAGELDRARPAHIRSADAALAVCAFEDATRAYGAALDGLRRDSFEYASLAERRAYAGYAAGVAERTAALFADALAAYEALGERQKVVEMLLFLSRQAWNDAETPAGYEHAIRSLALIDDDHHEMRDYARTMAASYAVHLGRVDEAEQLLAGETQSADLAVTARRLDTAASVQHRRAKADAALALSTQARDMADRHGDPDLIVRCYTNAGDLVMSYGRVDEACAHWARALVAAQEGGYVGRTAYTALGYANMLIERGDLTRARELYFLAGATGVTNASVTVQLAAVAARLTGLCGPLGLPFVSADDALALAIRSGESLRIGQLGAALAFAAIAEERRADARALLHRTLDALTEPSFADDVLLFGALYASPPHQARAQRMLEGHASCGAHVSARLAHDVVLAAARDSTTRRTALRAVAARYGACNRPVSEAFVLMLAGESAEAAMRLQAIGASAMASRLGSRTKTERGDRARTTLTRREHEVALLMAQQASNRAIAHALGITARTTEHHVAAVLARLGVKSRWLVTAELIARHA
jgi:DNA-binding NarL/FixJ family response regulator